VQISCPKQAQAKSVHNYHHGLSDSPGPPSKLGRIPWRFAGLRTLVSLIGLTCVDIEAGVVEGAHEELQADDGVDDDDKEDEEGDVHEGDDGHQDGVHHNLQT